MYRSSWCEIDLVQFRRNLDVLRRSAATKALLVVKANAYGHGLVRMAMEADAAGIDMLGVATIGEADELLTAGVKCPTLIMCALDSEEIDYCVAQGVHFMAWTGDHFRNALKAAEKYDRRPNVHLEVDTGMSRSGVHDHEVRTLLEALSTEEKASITGVMTHFHSADLGDLESAERQLAMFQRCLEIVYAMGLKPLVHAANSPGTIRIPTSHFDMVRLGIAAYGLDPSEHTPLPAGVAPILSWHAKVTNVKEIPTGRGVGYAWRYMASTSERVATLGIGYADGFRRSPAGVNTVLLSGREATVVGSIFMDQCVFLIPDGVSCDPGQTVALLSTEQNSGHSADDIAKRWLTNNYDVVSGIRSRVPRYYVNDTV